MSECVCVCACVRGVRDRERGGGWEGGEALRERGRERDKQTDRPTDLQSAPSALLSIALGSLYRAGQLSPAVPTFPFPPPTVCAHSTVATDPSCWDPLTTTATHAGSYTNTPPPPPPPPPPLPLTATATDAGSYTNISPPVRQQLTNTKRRNAILSLPTSCICRVPQNVRCVQSFSRSRRM